ncbi:DUF2309 domain-containing protein [Limibaculum sp. FT325]|uniref:YbcC family protein n=1 Tax=Thermohalobaculum sediminis TaxID=2939436 RepID=UPI0020BE52B3|nr:DUF2309 domain-containing protein [Limibaculum sediminis]MCL5776089.1 DUF2309 domain-containing protein [Limibaculum sediminis]
MRHETDFSPAAGRGPDDAAIWAATQRALEAIPPAWPLAATVAVNPFLGQAGEGLAQAAARLGRAAGIPLTQPRAAILARIEAGEITAADLAGALASAPARHRPADVAALVAAARNPAVPPRAIPTVADLAAEATGTDWPGIIADRITAWAGARFDAGQALWAAPREGGAYADWRAAAIHDLTPGILGLPGFSAHVAASPAAADAAIARAVRRLGLSGTALDGCFHRLLMTLGGWAQHARYLMWQAAMEGGADTTLRDLLAIRLVWEEALFDRHGAAIAEGWRAAREAHAAPLAPTPDQAIDAILQEAAERAAQRRLSDALAAPAAGAAQAPAIQAAFCIDVRSEPFRRALEAADPGIATLGFAGFFGLGVAHRGFASDTAEHRLPVLLAPGAASRAGAPGTAVEADARIRARARRAWGRFKLAAVSSFAFVEVAGPVYAARLMRDALALGGPAAADPAPRLDPQPEHASRVAMAARVLRAMSLTRDFAPLVLIAGHGAAVANNPQASALQCGACGGHSGEVNARLLAGLLNDGEVRAGLVSEGIEIPAGTHFLAGLHDTVSDSVTLFDSDHPAPAHCDRIARLGRALAAAGVMARSARALRLPGAREGRDLVRRGRDWAEPRPEWGLAGCRAFIAAPRARTAGRDLGGQVFLHDYDWRKDQGFGVLELILTAPVVVASWIALQYYGSAVAPAVFGSGNKLLHNVVGGIGVLEGNGGPLRAGLAWQSVHDGERLVHEALRLTVAVEAPREAISAVLARHEGLASLVANRWLHLLAMDDAGRLAWRHAGEAGWVAADAPPAARAA